MDIEQKRPQERNLSSYTYDYGEFYCSWANAFIEFDITVPVFIIMHFSVQARCGDTKKSSSDELANATHFCI